LEINGRLDQNLCDQHPCIEGRFAGAIALKVAGCGVWDDE
jgi:hypothetical protein